MGCGNRQKNGRYKEGGMDSEDPWGESRRPTSEMTTEG